MNSAWVASELFYQIAMTGAGLPAVLGEDPLRNLDPGGEISSGGLSESCGGSVETAGECAALPCQAVILAFRGKLAFSNLTLDFIRTRMNYFGILIMSSS